jgi:hypothetical protein
VNGVALFAFERYGIKRIQRLGEGRPITNVWCSVSPYLLRRRHFASAPGETSKMALSSKDTYNENCFLHSETDKIQVLMSGSGVSV